MTDRLQEHRHIYRAGWSDTPLRTFYALDEIQNAFPEVFGGCDLTIRDFADAVELVNTEGNYNEFRLEVNGDNTV
jgi:hypothetical protein